MKKRILIFSLAYHPHVGGAEVAIKEITDRIPREEVAFDVVTLRFERRDPLVERVGNVRVYRVAGLGGRYVSKVLFPLFAAIGAYRLHRKFRYDGWWVMMSYMLLPVALLRLGGVRLPYALTLQEGDTYAHMFKRLRVLPFLPLVDYGFRHATVIQAISNFLGEWARRRGFRGPLEIVPNGVDFAHFAGPRDRFVIRKELDIREDKTILITASRLVHKNAIDDCIRALPLLPGAYFLILGAGPEEKMLTLLARDLGVEDRVRFLGHIGHDRLPTYLQASTIFIRPSRSEGFGNSFVEAMAAGIPVIATQEGGIADFLFDAKRNPEQPTTGWAVDTGSPEQIAAAVRDILEHPEQARLVTDTAQALAREHYDWDSIAHTMAGRVFTRVTAAPRGADADPSTGL